MNFIAAMTAAAARAPAAALTVASDVRPAETTLGDIVAAGRRMGTRMTATGIVPGDIVACMLPNWREWLVVAVAAAQARRGIATHRHHLWRTGTGFHPAPVGRQMAVHARSFSWC